MATMDPIDKSLFRQGQPELSSHMTAASSSNFDHVKSSKSFIMNLPSRAADFEESQSSARSMAGARSSDAGQTKFFEGFAKKESSTDIDSDSVGYMTGNLSSSTTRSNLTNDSSSDTTHSDLPTGSSSEVFHVGRKEDLTEDLTSDHSSQHMRHELSSVETLHAELMSHLEGGLTKSYSLAASHYEKASRVSRPDMYQESSTYLVR